MSRLFLLFCAVLPAFAQAPIELGYRHMYNLEFNEAHRTFGEWKQKNPGDPLGYVSDAAAYLFAEFDRMHILQGEFFSSDRTFTRENVLRPDPKAKASFLRELETGERLAHDALAKTADRDANAMFAWVLSIGLRADYDGLVEKRYYSSIGYMKTGRLAAEKLLALDPACHDAYVAMGVEAYILGTKPMPVRWVLRLTGSNTDRDDGIRKVRLAAEGGHYLRPFARLLLAVAALRDRQVDTAREILRDLARQFPKNKLYTEELLRLDTLKQ
jgi:tetratricopeptide (TPR) repeat protein